MNRLEDAFITWLGREEVLSRALDNEAERGSLEQLLFTFRDEESFSAESALSAPVDGFFRARAAKLGIKPAPFWPDEKPYAFCVTHDIDRILSSYHGLRGLGSRPGAVPGRMLRDLRTLLSRGNWKENPFFNFERADAIEKGLGIRAAYYPLFERRRLAKALLRGEIQHFLGVYRPEDVRGELCRLAAQGHEIGLHASFDSWSGDGKAIRELGRERERLLGFGVGPVNGVRNHYLHFDPARTPAAQRKAGFSYDSTVGFNTRNGFRAGTAFPYRIDGIWELPFQVMDSALRVQAQGAEERRTIAFRALEQVRFSGGVFVLNWHLHTMNEEIFPEEVALYRDLVSRAKSDGAWCALPREVISRWAEREKP